MAREEAVASLMSLPLELRHSIFEYLSAREIKPRKLLRYWFENEEVKWRYPTEGGVVVLFSDDDCDTERESLKDEDHEEDTDDENGRRDEEEQNIEGNEDEAQGTEDADEDQEGNEDNENEATWNHGNAEDLPSLSPERLHKKWRHIPHFLRLTHCPPPVDLFLACRQLNTEAKNWYYDVAALRINATGSFAHTKFWQEAMFKMINASIAAVEGSRDGFSPLNNIRKAEVTFVWDSTWIRKDNTGSSQAILPALLRQRGRVVYQALNEASKLHEVVIHWHDSAQDNEATNLKNDVLRPFNALSATIKVKEYYIAPDVEPKKRSIAGKRRLEFENIYYMGLDHPF
ncbi:hypothetical protein yc1106_00785 [Curvularia clavata]|uniref:Uncharacterized protein n=1 Tax=Curvularia clavata TaxID=95742 RepID=A0A9Q8Z031_CURCL|nr:hypothetical protein yc1106_00785 [Curvularia clavata]